MNFEEFKREYINIDPIEPDHGRHLDIKKQRKQATRCLDKQLPQVKYSLFHKNI